MEHIFLSLVNISITAGWTVLFVLILRLLLKETPKWIRCVLWAFVGLRLVFPIHIESSFSLIPNVNTLPENITTSKTPAIESGLFLVDKTINPLLADSFSPRADASVNPLQVISFISFVLWMAGVFAMLLYTMVSYRKLYKKLNEAIWQEKNIWICDQIKTPFLFGILRPKIYLPSSMDLTDREYVLAHEQAHLMRRDYLWKPLAFLLLTIHWFNPVLWLAYILFCRDIELACDEKVLNKYGNKIKKSYSQALLNCSISNKIISVCPLAFGEISVKKRIQSVLHYKKPAFWVLLLAFAACILAAFCLLTNPVDTEILPKLDTFLCQEIARQHHNQKSDEYFTAIDYDVMHIAHQGQRSSIYAWVLVQNFSYENDICEESAAHTPAIITVEQKGSAYKLISYWTPRDGSYYAADIREHFPIRLWWKAMDSTRYITRQQMRNKQRAAAYFSTASSSSENKTTLTDLPPMVMVDGALYIDTGKKSTLDIRCGTPDGTIISSVPAGTVPTENNQSNFGFGYEYQVGAENTIEIALPDGWFIFAKEEPMIKHVIWYPDMDKNTQVKIITDRMKIAEIAAVLTNITWTQKSEGEWAKFSIEHPNHSIEIQCNDDSVKINLFRGGYAAILRDKSWQRYEISQTNYNALIQIFKIHQM